MYALLSFQSAPACERATVAPGGGGRLTRVSIRARV